LHSINNISVQFNGIFLFENISFVVNPKDRIGLTGKNGTGKSTLMKIISGELPPESGSISFPKDTRIGYLPQELVHLRGKTIYEEAKTAFDEILQLKKDMEFITQEISTRNDFESEDYSNLIIQLNEKNELFSIRGGGHYEENIERILIGLGFKRTEFSRQTNEFSGGWQMRVVLAKLLLQKPDILLLDEPTNHLDIDAIQWLEQFLVGFDGAVIMVSHDRAFLDAVTNRTIEINNNRIYDYKVSWSDYVILQQERIEQQLAAYNNQQAEMAEINRFIERFRYKATKAKQVQSRVKKLQRTERIEIDSLDKSRIHFTFPPAPRSGKVAVESHECTKAYGEHLVLKNLNFLIDAGDKVAFVGRNGEGKTTLSRMIVGELEYDGILQMGHNISVGYYAQNQDELLNGNHTVFETIDSAAKGEVRSKVRAILGSFLFGKEDLDKKVSVLSGGEKSRLALARLLLTPVNLLVLDEPTNHLDMTSKDILKTALLQYDGTLILVSHDRDFMEGITNKVFEFRNCGIKQYNGLISEYLESRKLGALKELEEANQQKGNTTKRELSDNKKNYEERKQLDKEVRKLENDLKKTEKSIESLDSSIAVLHEKMNNPETHQAEITSGLLFRELERLKSQQDRLLHQWEEIGSALEKAKAKRP
jgi:ATP-binding cassette, subfamily F, member 3